MTLHLLAIEDLQVPLEQREFPRIQGLRPERDQDDGLGAHREFVEMLDEGEQRRLEPVVQDHVLEAIDQDEAGRTLLLDELLDRLRDRGHRVRAEVILARDLREPSDPDLREPESRPDFVRVDPGNAKAGSHLRQKAHEESVGRVGRLILEEVAGAPPDSHRSP